jgi:Hypoxia induced protein conserved region
LACNLDCRHAARSANQRHAASSHVCDCLGIPQESGPWAVGIIVATGVGAVTIVLLLGLINMLRGGSPNRSQKLMRWRVGLQFAVIVIIMGILWLRG